MNFLEVETVEFSTFTPIDCSEPVTNENGEN